MANLSPPPPHASSLSQGISSSSGMPGYCDSLQTASQDGHYEGLRHLLLCPAGETPTTMPAISPTSRGPFPSDPSSQRMRSPAYPRDVAQTRSCDA
ncbi:hypothetical protein C0Q70_00479 [Pomacea canaliculata]|uniref:Uncharacterized protein n=1 Tax=Pomacea canaliculata TaxID=400727 RepID=A0A2T7PWW6_POMCA|nr:hypothetical protein C0Q70_00479 [Pomacea canaliculata]